MSNQKRDTDLKYDGSEIAIVGMACRFPGARTTAEFWTNLCDGVESIKFFSERELRDVGVPDALIRDPQYVRANGVLDDIDKFDAGFFGFSPREASILDPQHRLFLECTWEALEDAGHDPAKFDGSIGVFAGSGMTAYMMYNLVSNPELMDSVGEFLIRHTGNDKDFLTTRASYLFDLRGPSINVQTACSTSLVATHLASQHLLSRECDLALVGGVTIQIDQQKGYLYQDGEILSPDGHCRAFDAKAKGTIFGSGIGMVVLRRLSDAIEDGNTIHAIIRGSAVNNDGAGKVSYLAPSVDGQAEAIVEAIDIADVPPESVTYVEAHGTGTPVGDPIEVAALSEAYSRGHDKKGYCAIGSVKPNIGHLDTAAGIASLIKATLAVKHGKIPPTLHFSEPNPKLEIEKTPFYVNNTLVDWKPDCGIRRAGVSALGVGGTNAHLILEEPPTPRVGFEKPADDDTHIVLPISARTEEAVIAASHRLAEFLATNPGVNLGDVAFTLHAGRKSFDRRLVVLGSSIDELVQQLSTADANEIGRAKESTTNVFLFAGGGAQFRGMGADLYRRYPVYREVIDVCHEHMSRLHAIDLKAALIPAIVDSNSAPLQSPKTALPALFATEYALAKLLNSMGIEAHAMSGHSMGEYVAACLAGVFSLPDALSLVFTRGRLFETLENGAMLSVFCEQETLEAHLDESLDIAADNAPNLKVLSGPVAAIDALKQRLDAAEIDCQRVRIDVAAHSRMVEPILDQFAQFVSGIELNEPTIPFVSNVTGTWISAADATDPSYWTRHIRETVRFAEGLTTILESNNTVLFEVGPGRTLATLAEMHERSSSATVLTTMRHPKETIDDVVALQASLGRAWSAGVDLDWSSLISSDGRMRIPLPTYPFDKQRHWISPGTGSIASIAVEGSTELPLRKLTNITDWVNESVWTSSTASTATIRGRRSWLVLASTPDEPDSIGLLASLQPLLNAHGSRHHLVTIGDAAMFGSESSQIRAGSRADYSALIDHLQASSFVPTDVLHAWPALESIPDDLPQAIDSNFFALLYLAQAVIEADFNGLRTYSITRSAFSTAGENVVNPQGALVAGPCTVLGKELPSFLFQQIDLDDKPESLSRLSVLLSREPSTMPFAIRGGEFLTPVVKPVAKPTNPIFDSPAVAFQKGGTYVITGGMGGVGIELAAILGEHYDAKVILVGRTRLPERMQWKETLASDSTAPDVRVRLSKLVTLAQWVDVDYSCVDVADAESLKSVLEEIAARHGRIYGVLHAAGVLDDGPALAKTAESALSVLRPKTIGAANLVAASEALNIPLVVLFSSTSALLSPAGQVDYVSANSYLTALAEGKGTEGTRVISILWGMWRNLGMTTTESADVEREPHAGLGNATAVDHIIYEQVERTGSKVRYLTTLDSGLDWYINEHRLWTGQALAPGTLIVELVRAAFALEMQSESCRIDDLVFAETLSVPDGQRIQSGVELQRTSGDNFDACVFSIRNGERLEHAFATVGPLAPDRSDSSFPRFETDDIRLIRQDDRSKQEDWLQFGPRWKCLKETRFAAGSATAKLQLLPQYASEAGQFGFHPALLDLATGFALPLDDGFESHDDLYVPIAYGNIRYYRPLPATIIAEARLSNEDSTHPDFVTLDYRLLNAKGDVVAAIDGFAMKRVNATDVARALSGSDSESAKAELTLMEIGRRFGIEPTEGFYALEHCLSSPELASPIVTSVSWSSLVSAADIGSDVHRGPTPTSIESKRTIKSKPRDAIEQSLVDLWSSLLGVTDVGTQEDFFDLGGHSLIAVRLFTKIKREFGVDLSLATLFQAPTIEKSAQLIRSELDIPEPAAVGIEIEPDNAEAKATPAHSQSERTQPSSRTVSWSPIVPINPAGSLFPFFCVHGAGGNVLNFKSLSRLLGKDQPFFGLQAKGVDGKAEPSSTIEEMAADYVSAVVKQQPSGPYLLGGYSGGGVVAFEMAQLLRGAGKEVRTVVMFDTFCPTLTTAHAEADESRVQQHLDSLRSEPFRYLIKYTRRRLLYERNRLRKAYANFLTRFGRPLPIELREFKMITAYHQAQDRYHPRHYDGKVTLFTAEQRDSQHLQVPEDMGWAEWASRLRVIQSPGHHDTLFQSPNVEVLIRNLAEVLRGSDAPASHAGDGSTTPLPREIDHR